MRIYVDNVSKYSVPSSSLDTDLAISAGTHSAVVQAWDSSGAYYKAVPITISVSGATPTGSKTYADINQMTGWESCDKCAGPGGSGPAATISMVQNISTPSLDGKSAKFYLAGSQPYSSGIWWKQLGANPAATHFVYDAYFYVKDTRAVQGLEFDVNQSLDGKKFIFGTQCDVLDHRDWDVWDTQHSTWVKTGIYCAPPKAYSWNHLVIEFQRVNGQAKFISVTLNGQKNYINRAFWPQAVHASELNVAFQMDGNGHNTAYNAWVDKLNLTVW